MKKITIAILILLYSMSTNAQEHPKTISVSGIHTYTIQPEFTIKMMVSLQNVYYDESMSFSEVKAIYKEKLVHAGIDASKIQEDNLGYVLIGYDKKGTIITFKTTSIDEVQKFLNVKSPGVSKSEVKLETNLSEEQMLTYAAAAFEDAKKKAGLLAKKIGKNIGEVVSIGDTNRSKISESLYYHDDINSKDYYISVSFILE